MLNNFCFQVYAQKPLSHSGTLTLSHSHVSHYLALSSTRSRHAEQLLFSCLCSNVTVYSRKLQCFFLDLILTLSPDIRVHRAGSQLKIPQSTEQTQRWKM